MRKTSKMRENEKEHIRDWGTGLKTKCIFLSLQLLFEN